jgi:tetratricopeptide (TPR) repeat protein
MTNNRISIALAAALAAACATGGAKTGQGGIDTDVIQADHAPIGSATVPISALGDEIAISYYRNAFTYRNRGVEAERAGNPDQARAEYASAAEELVKFSDKMSTHEWALKSRYEGASLFLSARRYEAAATNALAAYNHKDAAPVTKAMAARVMANAWLAAANAQMKAGKLEPVKFLMAEQRGGKPPEPRVPPGEWKKFVDAADLYVPISDQDPEAKLPEAERKTNPPAFYAQLSGEVAFGFDNMQDAQRRFADVLQRWPQETEFVAKAVPLYLQTYLVLGDTPGYDAAVDRLRTEIGAQAEKAAAEKKPAFAKILADLNNANIAKQFSAAQKLLEAGKFQEAAESFERLAADPKQTDAVNALHNAAIAWDKAGNKDRAAAIRVRIVTEFADSKLAPVNQFQLAQRAAEAKKYDEAVKTYREFLEKWPSDRNRCAALQNVASSLDSAKKKGEAAAAYLAFGTDAECAKGDPNMLARALYRGGILFDQSKQPAKAKEAWTKAIEVNGVTDVVAKSWLADARKRLGK